MKTAAASVMSASASVPPMWNRMRKTSAFLRKLSLNAEKNWVQNRGAKRRVISRDEDMGIPVDQTRSAVRQVFWCAKSLKTTIWAKGQSPGGRTEGMSIDRRR